MVIDKKKIVIRPEKEMERGVVDDLICAAFSGAIRHFTEDLDLSRPANMEFTTKTGKNGEMRDLWYA